MKEKFYKNKNDGNILTEKEYVELLCREYISFWEDEEDEVKDNHGSLINYMIYMFKNDCDTDFILVDEDGNDYWKDEYIWNEE